MFFIVPDAKAPKPESVSSREELSSSPPQQKKFRASPEADCDVAGYYPKRTPKACDRCRLKKARCSGGKICEKCRRDGVVCTTNRETKRDHKAPNAEYVHLVESQRDTLLQALGRICESGASKDPTAVARILQDLGIGVEDLKRAPRQKTSGQDTVDLDEDLYRNAAEIQALLEDWNSPTKQAQTNTLRPTAHQQPPISLSEDESKQRMSQTGPQHMSDTEKPTDFASASPGAPAETLSPSSMLASNTEFDDWLALNDAGNDWSFPVGDFSPGLGTNLTGNYSAT